MRRSIRTRGTRVTVGTVAKQCVAVAGTYCGLGLTVPVPQTIIALFAVALVRFITWTKTQSIKWNISVLLLAMLAAFATVEGSDMNTLRAFWSGVGYGAMGVGIIEAGKSQFAAALKAGLETVFKSLAGTKKAD